MPPLEKVDRAAWLLLTSYPKLGSRTLYKLWKTFEKMPGFLTSDLCPAMHRLGWTPEAIGSLQRFLSTTDPVSLQRKLIDERIQFILPCDQDFPPILREIPDPPFALFLRGATIANLPPSMAVVGTRRPSAYGKEVTKQFVSRLALAGFPIISGLAQGIDGLAHEATLDVQGRTVAVLGGGVDEQSLYPRINLRLAQNILTSRGSIVSEMPPGCLPQPFHFPLRNRLIAALSRTILVIEAAEKSGSLITAHVGLGYNRDIFAVPGPVTSELSKGTNRLIHQGATPCLDPDELIQFLLGSVPPTTTPMLPPCSDHDREILDGLRQCTDTNELARKLHRPIHELTADLTRLELLGYITPH